MREITRLPAGELEHKAERDEGRIERLLGDAIKRSGRKIVVLDDDPTGVQTVHDVSVYTDWSEESVLQGFQEEGNLFYILTNSRGFTEDETKKAHQEIAGNIVKAARKTGRDFLIMSRGDSTLRGHYPLETQVLRDVLSREGQQETDGEVICPFSKRGDALPSETSTMSDTAGNWCLRGRRNLPPTGPLDIVLPIWLIMWRRRRKAPIRLVKSSASAWTT